MKKLISIFIAALTFTACGGSERDTTTETTTQTTETTTEITTIKTTTETTTEITTIETTTIETTTEITTNKPNIIIDNLQTKDILSGTNKKTGEYKVALIAENLITDNDLIELYNYSKHKEEEGYDYIIIYFGDDTGIFCDSFVMTKEEIKPDDKGGYLRYKPLGYYSISDDTITYHEY